MLGEVHDGVMARLRSRRTVALVLCCALVPACAPTRAASPPRPELVPAEPPPTTVAVEFGNGAESPHGRIDALDRIDLARSVEPRETVPTNPPTSSVAPPPAPSSMPAPSTAPPLTGWDAFDDSLRRSIVVNGSPSASVAVLVNGDPVHAAAFGEAVPGTGELARPDTRFRVASISKIVTAVVLLQLVQEGRVGLDQPVGGLLADALGVQAGPATAQITTEQLLSHTSGFAQHGPRFFGDGAAGCPDVGRWALAAPVGPPGYYQYSNVNYCLADLLIEVLLGQPYEAAVHERLLAPLGIDGMRLAGTYDVAPGDAHHFSRPGRNYMEALGGAGAWIATATDVARILDSIDPSTPGWSPLGPELIGRMRRPPPSPPDVLGPDGSPTETTAPPARPNGYGLGLILYPDGSVGHTGTLESTHAMVLNRPDGVTWAVLVNGEHPSNSNDLRRLLDRALAAGFPDG